MLFRKAVTTYEDVEVEAPLYYSQYLDHSTIYGRVEEGGQCVTVHEKDDELCYEIELEREHPNHYSCYLKSEYHSTKKVFDEALARAQKWIASLSPM